jgi:hypothetical protein
MHSDKHYLAERSYFAATNICVITGILTTGVIVLVEEQFQRIFLRR